MIATAGACSALLVALSPAASAHVKVEPEQLPADSDVRMNILVPNEEDKATTDEVQMQMPDGFAQVSYQPVPGWTVSVKTEKVSQPLQTDEGSVNEQVKTIAWKATDPSAAIQPGQFQDFSIATGMPSSAEPGDVLTFPAVQTYSNGDIVRWIGAPDSQHPAPQVTVTATGSATAATASTDESSDDSGAPTWLAVVALVLGALGALLGGAALARGRKADG
jgi:uncharacterized protein